MACCHYLQKTQRNTKQLQLQKLVIRFKHGNQPQTQYFHPSTCLVLINALSGVSDSRTRVTTLTRVSQRVDTSTFTPSSASAGSTICGKPRRGRALSEVYGCEQDCTGEASVGVGDREFYFTESLVWRHRHCVCICLQAVLVFPPLPGSTICEM